MSAVETTFKDVLGSSRVVVCLGSGGVGKTTTSAVIGLQAAIMGKKVLVCTVDPAKRLANSLGVSELSDAATKIPPETFEAIGVNPKGELHAMMLDMKQAFDRLIERHSPDEETRRKIFENRFYKHFSTSLAGTQEYSAMERLYELYEDSDYDLIVLDTAPTAYAIDFLDAPNRLFDALDSAAFEWLAGSGKAKTFLGLGWMKLGAGYVIKMLSRLTGSTFIEEFGHFVVSFGAMWDDFKARAARTREIMTGDDVSFTIITVPEQVSLHESHFLYDRLEQEGIGVAGIIVNRVHQPFVPQPVLKAEPEELTKRLKTAVEDADRAHLFSPDQLHSLSSKLQDNAKEFHVLSDRDAELLEKYRDEVAAPLFTVPFFSTDIYSFEGLDRIRRELFDLQGALAPAERTPGRL